MTAGGKIVIETKKQRNKFKNKLLFARLAIWKKTNESFDSKQTTNVNDALGSIFYRSRDVINHSRQESRIFLQKKGLEEIAGA